MTINFLQLPIQEQSEILLSIAPKIGKAPNILEKDIWLCWSLDQLFSMPNKLPMAFKGGTSLSKIFNAIQRFSEDIDITIDYRAFDIGIELDMHRISNAQIKKMNEKLKSHIQEYSNNVIKPYLTNIISKQFPENEYYIHLSENGEHIEIHYLSAAGDSSDYIKDYILIELGGRNITEPNEKFMIKPYISNYINNISLPTACVSVLSPQRTFWEKATLMHVACQRDFIKANSNRSSRHWYDLAMLSDHDIGKKALADRQLLKDVISHKKIFFNSSFANYDKCLNNELRLVPPDNSLIELANDYKRMLDAEMLFNNPPGFDFIIKKITALEKSINHG